MIAVVFVVGATAVVQVAMYLLGATLFVTDELPMLWSALTILFSASCAGLAYIAYVRVIEKRPVTEVGRSGALSELGIGTTLGAGLFVSVIVILWGLGYYRVIGVNGLTILFLPFIESIFAGVVEELVFRGIVFRLMEESLGTWVALAFSAFFFGFAHAANPNATLFSSLAIALEAGILLGAAYLFTRRLWIAIGLHFAWNFTQGGIFGIAVSGHQRSGLLQPQITGPDFLTGGEFGAEASIFAVLICLTAGVYLLWRAKGMGHWTAPFWKRA
ncbi:MAG: lysostaphin resistance A-like protein [Anaerolineae bacterium]